MVFFFCVTVIFQIDSDGNVWVKETEFVGLNSNPYNQSSATSSIVSNPGKLSLPQATQKAIINYVFHSFYANFMLKSNVWSNVNPFLTGKLIHFSCGRCQRLSLFTILNWILTSELCSLMRKTWVYQDLPASCCVILIHFSSETFNFLRWLSKQKDWTNLSWVFCVSGQHCQNWYL